MNNGFIIRRMTEEEVCNVAIKWAETEGWNPGLHDAHSFYETDKNGYFIGLLDGEPIACISAVSYDSTFGFIGFYIVKPQYRGKGYGLQIWKAGIDYLKKHNVGLDGVIEQQHNYKKSGFKLAYKNVRYEGKTLKTSETFRNIIQMDKVPLEEIFEYDLRVFPVPRRGFLNYWIRMPESVCLVSKENSRITGYSVLRKCSIGYKFGPLFANNAETARELYLASSNMLEEGTVIYLDTPETNPEAVKLAESYGMNKVFETARMYTSSPPEIDIDNIFGVTTFELG